jgi:hypothetical protein
VDEFTHDWEELAMQVRGISTNGINQSYVTRVKPHIQNKLNMHDITTMEKAKRKVKAVKNKFERSSLQRFDKVYS